jgi:hypothetical protein
LFCFSNQKEKRERERERRKLIMAPATNWLSFSLSPMEMLRSSESQFMSYESSSSASPHYLFDNFYADGTYNPSPFSSFYMFVYLLKFIHL